jgi:hypothetical protein
MRKYLLSIIGLVLLCLVAALGTATASPDTITVDSTTDVLDAAGDCDDVDIVDLPGSDTKTSLREAICAANNNPGSDTIAFNIPVTDTGHEVSGITGTWTISLASSLPILTGGGTIISGTTQGDLNPDGPEIEISGASMGPGHCLDIRSANNVVHELVINRCPGGIIIMGISATTNTVSGNYIGTDASGSTDLPNTSNGVEIRGGAQGNAVGGDTPEERNVISGNGAYGVTIKDSGTMSNTVSGNYIGTDASGTQGVGNGDHGVAIYGGAQNNTVGGDTEGERNIISDNGMDGVRIEGSSTTSNTISGNFIGTVVSGTEALGNGSRGVRISGAPNNTIGGDTEGERNVISGNDVGVSILGSTAMSNTFSGNYVGTDASGSSDLGNVYNGVEIGSNAQNNTVGGQTAPEGNVISGNGRTGVHIGGAGTDGNTVSLNYIGTDVTGTQDTGNDWYGVRVADDAEENRIGPGNLIFGNGRDGVHIYGSLTISNTITENSIYDNDWKGIDLLIAGANNDMPAPSIGSANCISITGTAPANSTVEVFTGPDDEGKTYLATCSADGAGDWSVTGPFTLDAYVTATATDAAGNTSEFSTAADGVCYPGFLPLTVKNY